MPIADDWNIDYSSKTISHVDGDLDYDTGAGTQPAVGDYIRSASGAVCKILSRTGTAASGTLTVTNTIGKFVNDEALTWCDYVDFDGVTNGGFKVGDTITGVTSTRSGIVRAIEYNNTTTSGKGRVYSEQFGAGSWTNDENIQVGGTTVAVADGTGADNSGSWTGALVNETNNTVQPPGTVETNYSVLVDYDAGSTLIPVGARIESATSGATGTAQQVVGATDGSTGSVRIIDTSLTPAWTDNETLNILDVVNYDLQVAGKVFSVGDVVVGATSGATGRVLKVIDDGDSTGRLILADETGTWDAATPDDINVNGVKIAEVENTTFTLAAATINVPNGARTEQRASQGGIYDSAVSLNIVRSVNSLYTYLQDTFDELGQLDDNVPMSAQVKDQAYTLINGWQIPDLSMRFLESGAIKDNGNNNIWTNYQTLGTIEDIGDNGYTYDSTTPTPQPNIYIEQNGVVLRQDWLEGNINVLIKVKTTTDTTIIDPSVAALGQLINSGTVTIFSREYLNTYDHFQTTTIGGVAPIPLATADDLNNNTGQYVVDYDAGSGATLVVGEEFTGTGGEIGIVTAQTGGAGATGTVTFVLKSSTNVSDNLVCTGGASGKSFTVNEPGGLDTTNDVVAGYNTDIRIMTVDRRFTGGTTTGTFVIGEVVTQTDGYNGVVLEDDGGTIYCQDVSGTASGTIELTGATSGATNTPTATADFTTVPKDIGDAVDNNYTAVISGNITNASPSTILQVYEWTKYELRSESTTIHGGPGSASGVQGRIYRRLNSSYAEVKAAPYGTFAGGKMFGARGVFIDKDTLVAGDLQNIQLIDNAGTTENPPNLQSMSVTGLVSGDSVSVYRSTGAASTTILRNEFDVGTVGSGNNQAADSTILVGANSRSVGPLPADVPDAGVLRILDPNDTGNYLRFPYNAVNRSTNIFTLTSGTIGNVTGGADLTLDDNVHVVFMERDATGATETRTVEYVSDIELIIKVREKGILPFETVATFGSTGVSVGAIRTADPIVNLP